MSAAATAGSVALEVRGVSRHFGALRAVQAASFSLLPGEIACLLGSSGSGKSTLLRVIAGLEVPDAGVVVVDGQVMCGPDTFVPPERRGIGLVFQDYALFPHLTLLDNVAFGLGGERRARRAAALAGLARVRLEARAADYPHMLSGGEQQRVALARALAPRPRVLLLDEPFSNLDRNLRDRVRDDTLALLRDSGTTALIVTHDPEEALRIADRIVLLQAGTVAQDARPEMLYRQPASLYAARFFGELIEMPGLVSDGSVATPLGRFDAPAALEGQQVLVGMRPHHLHLAPDGVPSRVLERVFLGSCWQLRLGVAGCANPVSLQVADNCPAARDDMLHLRADAHAALVYPVTETELRSRQCP